MAKPYEFDSPIITENGLKRVAQIIKANYPTNDDLEQAIGDVDLSSVTSQIQQLQTQISQVETRLSSIETDLDGLLEVMKRVVM